MADLISDLSALPEDAIEGIEQLTMRWLFQAIVDFGTEPVGIFRNSPDAVKDVAEDVTREVLDRLGGYNIQQRVFGNVDYKRARYVILPDQVVRQALFVDSKAEKSRTSARLQMSEISMTVKQYRQGQAIEVPGKIASIQTFDGEEFLTTTMLLHYRYTQDVPSYNYVLHQITLAAIPNGRLQHRYNPTADDNIWLAGPHAPQRGEEFRVRLSFDRLRRKAPWRVQRVRYGGPQNMEATWRG
jgi:hypothetical protein